MFYNFLLPTTLDNLDIANCTVSLNLTDEDNLGNVYVLTPETELYKNYLSYLFPITSEGLHNPLTIILIGWQLQTHKT